MAMGLSAKIDPRFLTDGFDMSTASGWLLLHILASIAEMERALLKVWTLAGLAAAHKRGGIGAGRKSALTPDKLDTPRKLLAGGDKPEGGETAASQSNKPSRRGCMTQRAM
jgi:DNA invertase Pin-like site-specific DNA recombinase